MSAVAFIEEIRFQCNIPGKELLLFSKINHPFFFFSFLQTANFVSWQKQLWKICTKFTISIFSFFKDNCSNKVHVLVLSNQLSKCIKYLSRKKLEKSSQEMQDNLFSQALLSSWPVVDKITRKNFLQPIFT